MKNVSMASAEAKILGVDDEEVLCDLLCAEVGGEGYLCTKVLSGIETLGQLAT